MEKIKNTINGYIERYNENIRKNSGSYVLKEINEELFPELCLMSQEEKIYYDSNKKQVSLLKFVLDNSNNKFSVVLLRGDGGMGKTVSMISSTESLYKMNEDILPIYIPLFQLNDYRNTDRLIDKFLYEEVFQYDSEVFEYFKKTDRICGYIYYFIDGFNELKGNLKNRLANEIKHILEKNRGRIIVASRDDLLLSMPSLLAYEDNSAMLEIQALKEEQVKNYLQTCKMDFPDDKRLQEVISNPLMLALYSNYNAYKIRNTGVKKYLTWYYEPVNAGEIIWNFLQTQVLKIWFENENIDVAINGYLVINVVAAYIGYKMEKKHIFSFSLTELKGLVEEISDIATESVDELCKVGIENEFTEGDASEWEFKEKDMTNLLKNSVFLIINSYSSDDAFVPQECKGKFIHQQFRDCYAAIYRKHLTKLERWYENEAWTELISPLVLRFCGELFSEKDLVFILDKLRGLKFDRENMVLNNVINICKIVYNNDFTNLNLADLDLREVYLGDIRLSSTTNFSKTKLGYNTFFPEGHEGKINTINVVGNGQFSISGGEDGNLIIWNLSNGRKEKKIEQDLGNIIKMDSTNKTNNGVVETFVIVANSIGEIIEIDIKNDKSRRWLVTSSRVTGLAYNPENNSEIMIATAAGELLIYNTNSGVEDKYKFECEICSSIYSSNGRECLVGCKNGQIHLINLKSKNIIMQSATHAKPVISIAASFDGKYIVSGSNDGEIKIWRYDVEENEKMSFVKLIHCDRNIKCIKFFPKTATHMASSFMWSTNDTESTRNLVLQYTLGDEEKQILSRHKHVIHDLAILPDGKKYVTASYDTTVKCYEVSTGICIGVLQGFNSWIRSIAFSNKGDKCILGSYDNTLKVWDTYEKRCIKTLRGHKHWVRDIEFLPNDLKFVSVSYDKTLRVWDATEPYSCNNIFEGHIKGISGVACSPNGKCCVSAAYDNTLILWNLEEEKSIVLKGHEGRVRDVAYSPKEEICVSASYDNTLIVWNCSWCEEKNRILKVLDAHTDYVRAVTFNSDGKYCISGSYDNTFIVWNTSDWSVKFQSPKFPEWIRCVECSPVENVILVGCDNGIIYIWDIDNNIKLGELKGHSNWIGKVRFFKDGRNCISCSDDNTVKIWDLNMGDRYGKCIDTYKILPYFDLTGCDFKTAIFDDEETEIKLKKILYTNGANV